MGIDYFGEDFVYFVDNGEVFWIFLVYFELIVVVLEIDFELFVKCGMGCYWGLVFNFFSVIVIRDVIF